MVGVFFCVLSFQGLYGTFLLFPFGKTFPVLCLCASYYCVLVYAMFELYTFHKHLSSPNATQCRFLERNKGMADLSAIPLFLSVRPQKRPVLLELLELLLHKFRRNHIMVKLHARQLPLERILVLVPAQHDLFRHL